MWSFLKHAADIEPTLHKISIQVLDGGEGVGKCEENCHRVHLKKDNSQMCV